MKIASDQLARVLAGEEKLLFDGAMGTTLQAQGVPTGEIADLLCITEPERITGIHQAYVDAGAQVITTNTFNSNRATLENHGVTTPVAEIFAAAVACARAAGPNFVAADIGSTGQMLEPYGDLEPEDAYELFAEQAKAGEAAGADFILIETIADATEAEIAIRAAKENTDLPVFASMTFEANGHTLMGDTVVSATERLQAAGADVVGMNCSHGPETLLPLVKDMTSVATVPVLAQPNAGMPDFVDGKVVYPMTAQDFAQAVAPMLEAGVTIVGSCCGSTPEFTAELAKLL